MTEVNIGDKFVKWTVLEQHPSKINRHIHYLCKCDCGKFSLVYYRNLIDGKSTGCFNCRGKIKPNLCKKGHEIYSNTINKHGKCRVCTFEASIRHSYGLNLHDYEAMYGFQLGKCAICGILLDVNDALYFTYTGTDTVRRAEIDHKHIPKKQKIQPPKRSLVRGLLCGGRYAGCNAKLGRVDNIKWLINAAKYLQNPPAQQVFKIIDEHNVIGEDDRD